LIKYYQYVQVAPVPPEQVPAVPLGHIPFTTFCDVQSVDVGAA
jgi:hypothetical protein